MTTPFFVDQVLQKDARDRLKDARKATAPLRTELEKITPIRKIGLGAENPISLTLTEGQWMRLLAALEP